MNSDFVKQAIFAFIRTFAAPIVAYVAVKMDITEDVVTTVIVAALTAAVMYVWSLFNKARYEEKVDTALNMPAASTRSALDRVMDGIKAGAK